MPQYKVMIARFPYNNQECPDMTDWLCQTVHKIKTDFRISDVYNYRKDDTPITMSRNNCINMAIRSNVDLVVMIDSDMAPDLKVLGARPFWDSAFHFWTKHKPAAIGVPYCGPPPVENVYVFRWATRRNDDPNPGMSLEQYGREDAAQRVGFEKVAALPTGLILIDVAQTAALLGSADHPLFYYEWKDKTEAEKSSTEDVTFTRDLSMAGGDIYVAWDSWAGHWKRLLVGKPRIIHADHVRARFAEAVRQNRISTEVIVDVTDTGVDAPNGVHDGKLVMR